MAITGLPNSGGSGGSGLTESQIKQIILAELTDPSSLIYNETLTVANTADVVRRIEAELPSPNGYNLLTQISELSNSIAFEVVNAALDGNGDGIIHQAIANIMLAPGGSGIIYNVIESYVENAIDSYANNINVGGSYSAFHTVYEVADDVIRSQLSLGGPIDLAIKAGGA